MDTAEWHAFEGLVASTHAMPAYGGVALARSVVENLAVALNEGAIPMHGHHDKLLALQTRNVRAQTVVLPDGELGVLVSGEALGVDWARLGEVRAFSVAGGTDLAADLWQQPSDALVLVAADAAWFEAADVDLAADALSELGPVRAQEYFQFSAIPDAKILVEAAWPAVIMLGPGLACNILWDGIKVLWRRRRTPTGGHSQAPTTVEMRFRDGERQLDAVVRTQSEEVARRAVDALPKALADHFGTVPASPGGVLTWSEPEAGGEGSWALPK